MTEYCLFPQWWPTYGTWATAGWLLSLKALQGSPSLLGLIQGVKEKEFIKPSVLTMTHGKAL